MTTSELHTIKITDRFTVGQAQHYYVRLMQALVEEQPLFVDLSEVQRIDTAGLQLLLRFTEEAQRLQVPLHWGPLSDAVKSALTLSAIKLNTNSLTHQIKYE